MPCHAMREQGDGHIHLNHHTVLCHVHPVLCQVRWTAAQTKKLIERMDASGDGIIDQEEFVQFADSILPSMSEGTYNIRLHTTLYE